MWVSPPPMVTPSGKHIFQSFCQNRLVSVSRYDTEKPRGTPSKAEHVNFSFWKRLGRALPEPVDSDRMPEMPD